MGVHGMSVDSGFTTPNLLEAETNRALIASAERLAVVVDHTKWGVRGLSQMAQLSDSQVLITDDGLGEEAGTLISEHVERLIVAPTGP
jgi:DeoR/GlpR family transcriptional regulator of sugar metabolism